MSDLSSLDDRTLRVQWQDPTAHLDAARALSGLQCLEAIRDGHFPRPPIAQILDFGLVEIERGRAVFECVVGERHYNPIGSVHGGLAATLLDSAMGCSIQSTLPAGTGYTTLELKVNYVRPMTARTGRVRSIGKVVHGGRRTAIAEGRILGADGKLLAHGTTTCLILSPLADSSPQHGETSRPSLEGKTS